MPQRNTPARRAMLAARAEGQLARGARLDEMREVSIEPVYGRFTPVGRQRKRLSTRGEQHGFDVHPTKKHTPGRTEERQQPIGINLTAEFLHKGMHL